MPNNKLKSLHNILVKKGIDNREFSVFAENFSSSPQKQEALYNRLKDSKLVSSDFESFQSAFFSQKKSPDGNASSVGLSVPEPAPVAEQNIKTIGGKGEPVIEANWVTGQLNQKGPESISVVPDLGSESPNDLQTILSIDVESGDVSIKEPTRKDVKTIEQRRALSNVREYRGGDYQSDAVERMERGMSDYEKESLSRKTPLEKLMYDTDVTANQYAAQSKAISTDQNNLSMAVDAIDEEISAKFGGAAFQQYEQEIADYQALMGEYNLAQKDGRGFSQEKADRLNSLASSIKEFQEDPLIKEREGILGAMKKNIDKYNSMQYDDRYAGVMKMVKDRQDIQKLANEGGTSAVNSIVVNNLAKFAASIGRTMDSMEKAVGMDKEYGPMDAFQDMLIDLHADAQFMWPTPDQYARPLVTSTAKWGDYEVDFDRNSISSIRKDGKTVDLKLSKEQEEEIMSLDRSSQWNLETAPWQMASTVGDMAVMLAGASKVKGALQAIGVGEVAAARAGVAMSTAGQMANDLYTSGLDMFDGDEQKAAQFSLAAGLSIGIMSNLFGLEASMIGGKGFFNSVPKMNVPAAVGKVSPMKAGAMFATHVVKQGAGEMVEESLTEQGITSLNAYLIGGKPQQSDPNEMVSNGVMGFAVGALFGGGSMDMNQVRTSALLAASENPELFGQKLREAVESGSISGNEDFISRQMSRVSRIKGELDKLDPDIKQGERLNAVALIDQKLQIEQRLGEVKGNTLLEAKYRAQLDKINEEFASVFDLPTPVENDVENDVAKDVAGAKMEIEEAGVPDTEGESSTGVPGTSSKPIYGPGTATYVDESTGEEVSVTFSEGTTLDEFVDTDMTVEIPSVDSDGNDVMVRVTPGGVVETEVDNVITEHGNISDGISFESLGLSVKLPHTREFEIDGKRMYNLYEDPEQAINYDESGDVKSVSLTQKRIFGESTSDNKETKFETVEVTGPAAEAIADQILATKVEDNEDFARFLESKGIRITQSEGQGQVDEGVSGPNQEPEKQEQRRGGVDPFGGQDPDTVTDVATANASGIASTGGLLTDTLAFIGLKVPDKAMEWMKKFYKKTFTSKGLLNSSIFDNDVRRRAAINGSMKRASYASRELKKAVRKEYGRTVPGNIVKAINDTLAGRPTTEKLTPEIIAATRKMRAIVENLSSELITAGVASGDLVAIIQNNMESYLTRSYRIHDDAGWINKVKDTSVWTRAKSYMESFISKEISDIEDKISRAKSPDRIASLESQKKAWENKLDNIDSYMEAFLNEQAEKSSPQNQGQGGKKLGSKNLGIFKKKKDIPKEIRELMGEYEDPYVNFTKSIFKMANLLENHRFLDRVMVEGRGKWLFSPEDGPQPGFEHKLSADSSSSMSPLNGWYTSAELKEGFERHGKADDVPAWIRPVVWLASKAKYSKTILSPATHVRNFMFNMAFHWANGHFGASNWKTAWDAVMSDIKGGGKEEYFAKLVELGVVYDSSTMGEIMALMENTKNQYGDMWDENNLKKRFLDPFTKTVEKLYQAEDDFHKIIAFETEKGRYAKAWYGKKFSDLSIPERMRVEAHAATIVRNTLPTYSLVSENVKRIKSIPLTGTFVSFPYEVLRTTANTIKLAKAEMSDPNTRHIGIKRAFGLLNIATLPVVVSMIRNSAVGLEDDDRIRDFLPPWSSDSIIIPVEKIGPNFTYVDLTSVLPQGYIFEVMNTLFDERRGHEERFVNMLYRMFEPFLGKEMTYKRLNEAIDNRAETGMGITTKDLGPLGYAGDILEYTSGVFEPGFVTTGRRIYESFTDESVAEYKKYNPSYELMALFPGIRVSNVNIEDSFRHRVFDLSDRANFAVRIYRKELRKNPDNPELDGYRDKAYKAYTNMFKELRRVYMNAIELGADPDVLEEHLKSFDREERDYLLMDETPPIDILEPKK